jgi:hypothetical protein
MTDSMNWDFDSKSTYHRKGRRNKSQATEGDMSTPNKPIGNSFVIAAQNLMSPNAQNIMSPNRPLQLESFHGS